MKLLLLAGIMLGNFAYVASAQPTPPTASPPPPAPTSVPDPPARHPGAGPWPAILISGVIRNRDYPASAMRSGHEGEVRVSFLVGRNGRVQDCDVESSSGSSALDLTTCGLILVRFRYDPARDANGWAIEQRLMLTIMWRLSDVESVDESPAAVAASERDPAD